MSKRHTWAEIQKLSKFERMTTNPEIARSQPHLATILQVSDMDTMVVCSCEFRASTVHGVTHAEEIREQHYARWGGARFLPSKDELFQQSRPLSQREMREREEKRNDA